jgi:hypothetical protein
MEYRYEEEGAAFRLTMYAEDRRTSTPFNSVHRIDMRPDWLLTILDVAKIAGRFPAIKFQPPKHILWFETDDNNNLVRFTSDFRQHER